LNTFNIADQVDHHPAADRLLLNLLRQAADQVRKPPVALPADFEARARELGYN
jgi:hypothetical protein